MGSDREAYLRHYGIQGQKWGVRNPETLARYNRGGGRHRFGDSTINGLKRMGSHAALEAPAVAKALATGSAINPVGIAVGIGTAAALGFALSEAKKTKTYKKGAAYVRNKLLG